MSTIEGVLKSNPKEIVRGPRQIKSNPPSNPSLTNRSIGINTRKINALEGEIKPLIKDNETFKNTINTINTINKNVGTNQNGIAENLRKLANINERVSNNGRTIDEHKESISKITKNNNTISTNIKKAQEEAIRLSKLYSDEKTSGLQNIIKQSVDQQKETDRKQDELFNKWNEWGKKNNNFNADNYVSKLDFNKSKESLKYIPINMNNITELEKKNKELENKNKELNFTQSSNIDTINQIQKSMETQRKRFNGFKLNNTAKIQKIEQKVESKLDDSQLSNNVTIKQIQENLNSKISPGDPVIKSLETRITNNNTNNQNNSKKITDINRELNSKLSSKDLKAKMDPIENNLINLKGNVSDNTGSIGNLRNEIDQTIQPNIKTLQEQVKNKLSSQDLSANISPINEKLLKLRQNISDNTGSIGNLRQGATILRNEIDKTIQPINRKLVTLGQNISDNTGSIGNLRQGTNSLRNDIDQKIQPNIKTLQEQVKNKLSSQDLSANISPINEKLFKLRQNISDNTGSIGNFRQEATSLRNKIDQTIQPNIKSLQQQMNTKLSSEKFNNSINPINSKLVKFGQNIETNNTEVVNLKRIQEENNKLLEKNNKLLEQKNKLHNEDFNRMTDMYEQSFSAHNRRISNNYNDIKNNLSNISKINQELGIEQNNTFSLNQPAATLGSSIGSQSQPPSQSKKVPLKKQVAQNLEKLSTLKQDYDKTDTQLVKLIKRVDRDHDDRIKSNTKNISDNNKNIKKKQEQQDLNIKNIQKSLDNKIGTNSSKINSNKNSIENNSRLTKNLFNSSEKNMEEMKKQNLNVRRNINTKLLKHSTDIRNNTESIDELKNTTIKQIQENIKENSKRSKEMGIGTIKQLSNVKEDVSKQLKNLRGLVAMNSINIRSMNEDLEKQKLLNLVYLHQITKMKKNPFFNLKM